MQQDTIDGLVRLRQAIVNDLGPLVAESNLPISERFDLYLRLARSQSGVEYYERAYELVKDADTEEKLNLYLGLLSDVDFELNKSVSVSESQAGATQPEIVQQNDEIEAN